MRLAAYHHSGWRSSDLQRKKMNRHVITAANRTLLHIYIHVHVYVLCWYHVINVYPTNT